jgi:hypothetical protein
MNWSRKDFSPRARLDINEEERALIARAARHCGLPVAAYLRWLVLREATSGEKP